MEKYLVLTNVTLAMLKESWQHVLKIAQTLDAQGWNPTIK